MFSGKTEELIRRLRRALIARQKLQVFKPKMDNRYHTKKVTSHTGLSIEAKPVESAREIPICLSPETTVVGIDEAQFFEPDIGDVCEELALQGKRIICAGLDTDFRGKPFGSMPALMAQAEFVDKLQAICIVCGEPATRTQRLIDGKPASYHDPILLVGADEVYEARCRHCHVVGK
ncbi:MAG: thymidine kinase [Candidatus Cloacimonetes bacterium 4572_55]|nr:MAG: thymidine kinase [Candidatus Cloacimonetes bacterium 4572_55]